MAAAKVECEFYGSFFLEKVTCARKLFFFFFKNWLCFGISITLTG